MDTSREKKIWRSVKHGFCFTVTVIVMMTVIFLIGHELTYVGTPLEGRELLLRALSFSSAAAIWPWIFFLGFTLYRK
jgi:hypothetical protein